MDEYYQAVRALPAWLASLLAQLPVQTAVRIQELRLRTGCAVTFTVQGRQCSASALPGCPPKLAAIRLNALQIEEIFHTLCNGSVHTHERELAEGYLTTAVGNRVGVAGQFVQREGQCIALQKVTSLNLRIARSCVIPLPPALDKLLEQHFTGLLVVGEPGSGKTTTLMATINALKDDLRIGVMEADIDSDVDAATISTSGAKVIQLHTGGMCHLDAGMTRQGLEGLGTENIDLAILENVGNLVCPAEFDTGAVKNAMILSVPEGDDKPLKYPLMFSICDVLLVNKIDVAPYFNFDLDKCVERVKKLNPNIQVFPISALKGEGIEPWADWLRAQTKAWNA